MALGTTVYILEYSINIAFNSIESLLASFCPTSHSFLDEWSCPGTSFVHQIARLSCFCLSDPDYAQTFLYEIFGAFEIHSETRTSRVATATATVKISSIKYKYAPDLAVYNGSSNCTLPQGIVAWAGPNSMTNFSFLLGRGDPLESCPLRFGSCKTER